MEVDSSPSKLRNSPKKPVEDGSSHAESSRNTLPQIVVKKEPTSPEPPVTARHRPPKLSLAKGPSTGSGGTPRTGALTGALTADKNLMHEVGMACLSPGFSTQDPAMREQLQRSISVRDQQRSIIESRLNRHARPGEDGGDKSSDMPNSARGERERGGERTSSNERPLGSARRRPPSSLTIVPPPHRAFANERVVQSAPLNQSFTGRHHHPLHLQHTSNLPPPSTHSQVNRLPPITDVFGPEKMDGARPARPDTARPPYYPTSRPSYPSPNSLANNRPREYSSAEEAVQQMAGGREDMLPRIIHYGGHQPPTPPSPPMPTSTHPHAPQHYPAKMAPMNGNANVVGPTTGGRRRGRAEYERDGSYGSDTDAHNNSHPDNKRRKDEDRRKKEEFLDLCSRAWDLLHS
ncbi:hypothetical protein DFH27DRAFT_523565 [Peziza echinospora]|nr:hypothetical protein DFH27DRAFT_523565 [Peziza echinospora]